MSRGVSERDFESLSWHDNHVHGIEFRTGEPEAGDWTSDLVLDIDHIVEWICDARGEGARFRIAPADLVFHDVTDLKVVMDWSPIGFRIAHHLPSIDHIERSPLVDQQARQGRPYHAWRVCMNAPAGGEITFGASGFTQTLRGEPILCDEQYLRRGQRDGAPSD